MRENAELARGLGELGPGRPCGDQAPVTERGLRRRCWLRRSRRAVRSAQAASGGTRCLGKRDAASDSLFQECLEFVYAFAEETRSQAFGAVTPGYDFMARLRCVCGAPVGSPCPARAREGSALRSLRKPEAEPGRRPPETEARRSGPAGDRRRPLCVLQTRSGVRAAPRRPRAGPRPPARVAQQHQDQGERLGLQLPVQGGPHPGNGRACCRGRPGPAHCSVPSGSCSLAGSVGVAARARPCHGPAVRRRDGCAFPLRGGLKRREWADRFPVTVKVTPNARGDTFWNPVSAFQPDVPFGFFRVVLRPFHLNTFQR